MVEAVESALDDGANLLVEAPTGTGKSLAYGVPATAVASQAGRRAVVVTANIALQEQLIERDLPLLGELLPWSFSYALLKGLGNYLCRDRLARIDADRGRLSTQGQEALDVVLTWAAGTDNGDVSELESQPSSRVWSLVSTTSDDCKGSDCPLADRCFGRRAREQAREADVIVTNYHLLFAHFHVREATGQDLVLPALDVVVLDEAHKTAEIAREFFGFRVSFAALRRLARPLRELGQRQLATELEQAARDLAVGLGTLRRRPEHRVRLRSPGLVDISALRSLLARARRAYGASAEAALADDEKDTANRLARLAERCRTVWSDIEGGVGLVDPNVVVFIEEDRAGLGVLRGREIDVSQRLHSSLFGAAQAVVATSATLTTAGSFERVRADLGAGNTRIIEVETPFDYARQALLVVPEDMPAPTDRSFPGAVAAKVEQAVRLANGRTLALFTSYRNLEIAHRRLQGSGFRVLRQGERPRTALVEEFRRDVHSVLLGTESFWAGVDVPGEALSCVVIDRLPFSTPDDPVLDAIRERDRRWFMNHGLPRAALAFKQGFGRLIRSGDDRGVVVVLDRRLIEKPYGRLFLSSLPFVRRTRRMDSIAAFLAAPQEGVA